MTVETETLHLTVVTFDRKFFEGEVQAVVLETPTGQREILPLTLPCVFILAGGMVRIKQNDRWMEAIAGEGFVKVDRKNTVVMAETCEWPHEVDETKVQAEIEELDEEVKKAQSLYEYKMAKAHLAIQIARLRAKRHIGE